MDFGITHKWGFNHVSTSWFVQVRFVDFSISQALFSVTEFTTVRTEALLVGEIYFKQSNPTNNFITKM